MKKKGLLSSYVSGVLDIAHGERYKVIFSYFIPEYVTALLLYSLPIWIDAWFVAQLTSTSRYATLGVTNNLLHLLTKVAEAVSVGTVVLAGQFNGRGALQDVGRSIRDAFWVTIVLGSCIAGALFFGAYWIYYWYGVPDKIITLGVPFLRMRALGILFTYVFMAFIGFLRGIKNVKTPMKIFLFGSIIFILCDYVLIFGKFGFPAMGLEGSAIASVIQYGVMLVAVMAVVLGQERYAAYKIHLFRVVGDPSYIWYLVQLSWPVLLDKATMAVSYIWLCKMFATMGKIGLATFCVIKDMERFAFLPAIAMAQVVTFLASNDYGRQNWQGIKNNIKKIIFIASTMVLLTLIAISLKPEVVIHIFDTKGKFTSTAAAVFPVISVLIFFDVLQLILAGALRGTGNVRVVMFTRLIISFAFFVPVSYFLSHLTITNDALRFILIYGSFYIGNALMSLIYIKWLRGTSWKTPLI